MAAEVTEANLSKVDSAIDDAPASPSESKPRHRRTSSTVSGVFNILDLGKSVNGKLTVTSEKEGVDLKIAPETQKLNWKLNTSPSTVDDKEVLSKLLTTPPIKKIDLQFPLGLEVTARNLKGVTIKDALDAIHKQFKKKADDELDKPYLAGFEWDREECYTRFIVHQKATGEAPASSGKKKKGKKDEEA
ncbi:Hypothetical protein R9X50_00242300 [Acrodontium crateriforme]|uniref:DUF6699 domain-containing protein n=1 Tax=Acrodontium crateriforme TaxID=150365 RepID=A0AAQ3M488_9PEZI|nr:Hypothetical protein R9X50_00242300 [Acrodontium crateriforme]